METLKRMRKERGWSQARLAREAGLSTRTIERTERGHTQGLQALAHIAQALGITVDDLRTDAAQLRSQLVSEAMTTFQEGGDLRAMTDQLNLQAARLSKRGGTELGSFTVKGRDLVFRGGGLRYIITNDLADASRH